MKSVKKIIIVVVVVILVLMLLHLGGNYLIPFMKELHQGNMQY